MLRPLLLAAAVGVAASDDAVAHIRSGSSTGVATACAKCNEYWGLVEIGASNAVAYPVVWAEPKSGGCTINESVPNVTNSASFRGAAVVFTRGSCFFSAMVDVAAANNATAVFIVNQGNRTAVVPGANNASDYAMFRGPVCMLDTTAEQLIGDTATDVTVSVFWPDIPVLDASSGIFLAVALMVLVTGSMWNTHRERERAAGRDGGGTGSDNEDDDEDAPERGQDQALMTRGTVVFFLVFASVFLMLLYFFYKYLIYVLLVGFGLFGALSVYEHLAALLSHTTAWKQRINLPGHPDTPWPAMVATVASLGLSIAWGLTRSEDYSWMLQDVLGVSILITMVRVVTIPNLKLATALLSCLLIYDVFFVFITPLITPDGSSVMVNAATGNQTEVDANGCESYSNMMPFLLRVPALSRPLCSCPHYSMLGFGDVALPGFVVSMTLRFDYALAINGKRGKTFVKRYAYFLTTLTAYFAGLIGAFVAASQMATAQPALLYLSPAVLLSIWIPGWLRGHLGLLYDIEGFLGYSARRRSESHRGSGDGSQDDMSRQLLGHDSDDVNSDVA